MRPADLTLSAGPNDVSSGVKAALSAPIAYHYDPAFKERFRATEEKIGRIFGSPSHEVILMQGEAILGLEAAARSLVRPGTKCLNLVSGVFGKGFGHWLSAYGAELHEIEVPYDDAVTAEAVDAYLTLASRHHGRLGRPLGDPVGHAQPGLGHRPGRPTPRRGDGRRRRLVVRGHRAAARRVAARPHRRRAPEVPRRPTRHVADGAERARLGGHRREPRRAARLVPVDHGLARQVARARAASRTRPRSRTCTAWTSRPTSCSPRACDESIARHQRVFDACWAGVEAMGLRPWPGQQGDRVGLRVRDPRPRWPDRRRRCATTRGRATASVLGRAGRGQHHPHRPHGRHGAPDDDRSRAWPRSGGRLSTSARVSRSAPAWMRRWPRSPRPPA